MSNLERDYFYMLDWAWDVADIREQYPLLPIEETLKLAEACGVKHPTDPATRTPIVMTTDFVVTMLRDGRRWVQARTVKPSNQLNSRRVLEKLEIERRYWKSRGIDWGIVTERNLPSIAVRNIDVLRVYRRIDNRGLTNNDIAEISRFLNSKLSHNSMPLTILAAECDEKLGYAVGSSLAVAFHLIATHQWGINLNQPFNPTENFSLQEGRTIDADLHQHLDSLAHHGGNPEN